MLTVTFHGVRGSTPCHGPSTAKYGGNTSCVSVRAPGRRPILLDLGTGLRYFGKQYSAGTEIPLKAIALVTHLHWDHVQGLPFFTPMLHPGASLEIFGPQQSDGSSFESAMKEAVSPPTFPVGLKDFPGNFSFNDVSDNEWEMDEYKIMSRLVPHIGPTVGYRLEFAGSTIAYISDHQQPLDGSFHLPDGVRELAEGVDLLIHDSQYTPQEFSVKNNWGHCTAEFAIEIAAKTGAKRLALYHHDPDRTDAALDAMSACGAGTGMDIFFAREGGTISV